jgi:Holliday junction DNA helicase RuvB
MNEFISDPSLLNGHLNAADEKEVSLRPKNISEFIGQHTVVQNVNLMIQSALLRKASCDHMLFCGPPGLGKTSLAMLIAQMMNTKLHLISGPALEKKGDLAAVLTNLEHGDVLFIDEIHRLHISLEELLYSAIEDFRLDIVMGQGPSARTMQIGINPFTLIGATTRAALLSGPLRDRFQCILNYDFYQPDELVKILKLNAQKMSITLTNDALLELAKRSRGTPRIALRILRRVRDLAIVSKSSGHEITMDLVHDSLKLLSIDALGLDAMDLKILKTIRDIYQGGPVGIEALASTLAEDRSTIESVYEPFLLKEGLILRTSRGRVLSEKALKHLNETL